MRKRGRWWFYFSFGTQIITGRCLWSGLAWLSHSWEILPAGVSSLLSPLSPRTANTAEINIWKDWNKEQCQLGETGAVQTSHWYSMTCWHFSNIFIWNKISTSHCITPNIMAKPLEADDQHGGLKLFDWDIIEISLLICWCVSLLVYCTASVVISYQSAWKPMTQVSAGQVSVRFLQSLSQHNTAQLTELNWTV